MIDPTFGAAGVDLFFVISGFIMVHASARLFGAPGASLEFLKRRLIRIIPLYWLCTIVMAMFFFFWNGRFAATALSTFSLLASLLFYPYSGINGDPFPIHTLGWTLNFEMFFYFVFGSALILSNRLAIVMIISMLFVALVSINSLVLLPMPFKFWSDAIILEFCFGMLIGIFYQVTGLRSTATQFIFIALAAALLWCTSRYGSPSYRAFEWGIPAALLLWSAVICEKFNEVISKSKILSTLGDASYSIYLIHFIVIFLAGGVLVYFKVDARPLFWLYAVFLFVASLVSSILVYFLFERPVTAWLRARTSRPDQAP